MGDDERAPPTRPTSQATQRAEPPEGPGPRGGPRKWRFPGMSVFSTSLKSGKAHARLARRRQPLQGGGGSNYPTASNDSRALVVVTCLQLPSQHTTTMAPSRAPDALDEKSSQPHAWTIARDAAVDAAIACHDEDALAKISAQPGGFGSQSRRKAW